jgi:hypothetical protein
MEEFVFHFMNKLLGGLLQVLAEFLGGRTDELD